ncbi:hypothetical protein GGC64_006248 [Mycobacterium sp. OAS707]|uniref:DMT family transporter n=1 Tax=Mycobacterium sp. OAS707 TaxID=2663822 RepID=UPI00178A476B|nr:hypothetical protein [Mycobacterium sp. OAS707]
MIGASAVGVTAAFLFALSAFLQQRAARLATGGDTSIVMERRGLRRLLHALPRSRTWLRGWAANLCGWIAQAAALKMGSVATVQPLMSAQLLFAVGLASAEQRRWPRALDWLSALAVCAGLVVLLTTEGQPPLIGAPKRAQVLWATVCTAALVVLLVAVGRRATSWVASMLLGAGAGVCHAMNAVFIKMTIHDLTVAGVAATARDWPGYTLALCTLCGLLLGQLAFASGALPPEVAAINVANPMVALVAGLLAFDAPISTTPGSLSALAVAVLLIAAGVIGLAHAPSARLMYTPPASPASDAPAAAAADEK